MRIEKKNLAFGLGHDIAMFFLYFGKGSFVSNGKTTRGTMKKVGK
jgi:hypothetical protein